MKKLKNKKEKILLNVVQQAGEFEVLPLDLIEFHSTGKLLVIADNEMFERLLPHLSGLQLYFKTLSESDFVTEDESVTIIKQSLLKLDGWLGEYTVQFETDVLTVDMVLDFSAAPLIDTQVPPLGYYAVADNEQKLAQVLPLLAEMVGTFDKPKYFDYNQSICAHSRRGITACTQCLDACPADAISSTTDAILVNPSLCQGCGSCTTVCPSGAITYQYPSLEQSLNRLKAMLKVYFAMMDEPPVLLIHDLEQGQNMLEAISAKLQDNVIAFSIEEIGALGMPFWLAAIAYGIGNIIILDAKTHDDHDWLALQQEITKTNQMLTSLGYVAAVNWLQTSSAIKLTTTLHQQELVDNLVEKATFAGLDDKRRVIQFAMAHLHQYADNKLALLQLNGNAAFGEVIVDKQACTLCMSCVSVCPVGALTDGRDKPQLNFVEDLCVQCGMCHNACPEDAITLNSRYLFDREQARQVRLLHEEAVFNCIRCAKPFATQKMIDTMTEKLKDHPMFQGDALDKLKMCEDCRVTSMFDKK
jgi:ferredoxin